MEQEINEGDKGPEKVLEVSKKAYIDEILMPLSNHDNGQITGQEAGRHTAPGVSKNEDQERTKSKKELFLELFMFYGFNIKLTCLKIGIDRSLYYKWQDTDLEFKEKVEDMRNSELVEVEQRLKKAIENDNVDAIIFYLSRRHPDYRVKNNRST